jgi:transposase
MESTLIKDFTPEMTTLAVAFELSKASWKIGLHDSKRMEYACWRACL